MPKLEYFLVAESISTDKDRNLVSVFHVLEDIACPIPCAIPQMVAISSWILQPEDENRDFQVGFEVVLPGPEASQEKKNFSLNFTAKGSRQRAYFRFVGIPIDNAGNVVFNLLLNGEHKASHILTVRHSDEAED